MRKIYRAMIAELRRLQEASEPADPFAGFTAQDWADLPAYHPLADDGPRAGRTNRPQHC